MAANKNVDDMEGIEDTSAVMETDSPNRPPVSLSLSPEGPPQAAVPRYQYQQQRKDGPCRLYIKERDRNYFTWKTIRNWWPEKIQMRWLTPSELDEWMEEQRKLPTADGDQWVKFHPFCDDICGGLARVPTSQLRFENYYPEPLSDVGSGWRDYDEIRFKVVGQGKQYTPDMLPLEKWYGPPHLPRGPDGLVKHPLYKSLEYVGPDGSVVSWSDDDPRLANHPYTLYWRKVLEEGRAAKEKVADGRVGQANQAGIHGEEI